jgi:hypothetical protein
MLGRQFAKTELVCEHAGTFGVVERNMKAFLILLLVSTVGVADPSPRISAWKRNELNETFMRTLTKQQCMTKTIAALGECSSQECTKNLGGISGDCVIWAKGDLKTFCATYDLEYIDSYCANSELDTHSCLLLRVAKSILCKPDRPLK